MRKVKFKAIDYELSIKTGMGYTQVEGTGLFHQWGTVSTEFDSGGVTDSVGLVEREDGRMFEVYPRNLQFIDK